jgi:D-glycero-alpha-D-manno-heptose-7-phosphate kinase
VTANRLVDLFDYSIRVSYSKTELINTIDEIKHPSVRECFRFMDIQQGIEITYIGDLPAGTGLGSSSSFTVGLLNALHCLKGEKVSREGLAEEAVYVEQEMIGERVGVQDQYTCAIGGLVHLKFETDGKVIINNIHLTKKRLIELKSHLLLFYTNITRFAHKILDEQIHNTKKGEINNELSYLNCLVDQGLDFFNGNKSIDNFGELLHDAWVKKKRLSRKISSPKIDKYYQKARKAGAIGGKLLGAGGGGFLLMVVKPDKQVDVKNALAELHCVPFDFDNEGSIVTNIY